LVHVSGYPIWPTFPKSYFATLVIAEKNDGGFYDFLVKLWEMVKEKVIALITAALGAAFGSLIGTHVIPGLGTIIGAVVGWVVGTIFGWLKDLFSDWVFAPFTVSVSVPSLNASWPGGRTDSSDGWIQYQGFGGTYQLIFDWQVFA
jgi:Glycine zipper